MRWWLFVNHYSCVQSHLAIYRQTSAWRRNILAECAALMTCLYGNWHTHRSTRKSTHTHTHTHTHTCTHTQKQSPICGADSFHCGPSKQKPSPVGLLKLMLSVMSTDTPCICIRGSSLRLHASQNKRREKTKLASDNLTLEVWWSICLWCEHV